MSIKTAYVKSSRYRRYVPLCVGCGKEEVNPLTCSGDNLTSTGSRPPYCYSCKRKQIRKARN